MAVHVLQISLTGGRRFRIPWGGRYYKGLPLNGLPDGTLIRYGTTYHKDVVHTASRCKEVTHVIEQLPTFTNTTHQ